MAPKKERHTCLGCAGLVEKPEVLHGTNALCKDCFSDIPRLEDALEHLEVLRPKLGIPLAEVNAKQLERHRDMLDKHRDIAEDDERFKKALEERIRIVRDVEELGLIRKKMRKQ